MKRICLALLLLATPLSAADIYVSTTGTTPPCGTIGAPCNLFVAWKGTSEGKTINPGDTIWVRGGDYKLNIGGNGGRNGTGPGVTKCWRTGYSGTAAQPIIIRAYPGEKAALDFNMTDYHATSGCGGLIGDYPNAGGGYIYFMNLFMYNSNTTDTRFTQQTGGPNTMNEFYIAGKGSRAINNWIFDAADGILKNPGNSGNFGGANIVRGHFSQYGGFVSDKRGAGHSYYIKNGDADGEAGRSFFDGNTGLRAFSEGLQVFGELTSYVSITNHIEAATGWQFITATTGNWPAAGCCYSPYYLGNTAAVHNVNTQCHQAGSSATFKLVFTDSMALGGGNNGITFGSTKGGCDYTVTGNDFEFTGSQTMTCSHIAPECVPAEGCGMYPPFILTGNTFYAPLSGGGCPVPPLTNANYGPAGTSGVNTVNAGIPGSGTVKKYWASPDQPGWGWATVKNYSGAASVTIDLQQMGGFPGQQYIVLNWQDNDPWTSTPIASGTCPGGGCPTALSVPTTCTGSCVIRQPAFTKADGVTPFDKPPDLGPYRVQYRLYVDPASITGGTPTPTPSPTFTPSPTSTNTPSPTFTNTFTPTRTPTPTFTPTGTVPPTNTFTPSPTTTLTFTPSNTPTATPTPPPSGLSASFAFGDTTYCTVTAPMATTVDPSTFPGSYVSSPTLDTGKVVCNFVAPTTGQYRVWLKTYGATSLKDSFYIDVDGDHAGAPTNCLTNGVTAATCPYVFDNQEQQQPCVDPGGGSQFCNYVSSWDQVWWNPLNDRTVTCGNCVPLYAERRLSLTAGPHTISFRQRDPDARLYYAIITTNFAFTPTDPVAPVTPSNTLRFCRCNNRWGVVSVPAGTSFLGPCVPCPF